MQEIIAVLMKVKIKIQENSKSNISNNERILLQMVKVSEELGELSNEVLHYFHHQRTDKERSSDLSKEMADVIFSAILLGLEMNIDIDQALTTKLEIIKNRYN